MNSFFSDFLRNSHNDFDNQLAFIAITIKDKIKNGIRNSDTILEKIKNLKQTDLTIDYKAMLEQTVNGMTSNLSNVNALKQVKLKSVQVKNFKACRSYSDQENGVFVEFLKENADIADKVIFYAPNGGGKTTLCEALEFKLTGEIKECLRRNQKISEYIKNDSGDHLIKIKLNNPPEGFDIDDLKGQEEDFFSKAFIEKNRIQEFALFGSKDTKTDERDIISIIIGLENAQSLIDSLILVNSFESNVLKMVNTEVEVEYTKLKDEVKRKKDEKENKLLKINENEQKLLELVKIKTIDLAVIKEYIEKLDREIESKRTKRQLVMEKLNFQAIKFSNILEEMLALQKEYSKIINEIAKHTTALDLKAMYEIALRVQATYEENFCPLCGTDFIHVKSNPFERSKNELEKLQELEILKTQYKSLSENFFRLSNSVKKNIDFIIKNLEKIELTRESLPDIPDMIESIEEVSELKINQWTEYLQNNSSILDRFVLKFNEFDRNIESIKVQNLQVDREVELLIENKKEIRTLSLIVEKEITERKSIDEDYAKDLKIIDDRMLNLREIKEINSFKKSCINSYSVFRKKLIEYKKSREKLIIQGIESKVRKYYCYINKHDSETELLTDINFVIPDNESGKYDVLLKKQGCEYSAKLILSEGHLRALGLSIFLAIAEKNEIPFIVFDDIVNAIDTDHRSNLVEMFFNDDYLKNTQLIITTHDRLFWERFCNLYKVRGVGNRSPNEDKNISYIIMMTNFGPVFTQYNVSFEWKVTHAISSFDIRQALVYSRIWFETMVLQHCIEQKKNIVTKFQKSEKANLLRPSLESIYNSCLEDFPSDTDFEYVKKNLINWQGLNQEHHAFDENSWNFIHSKTSNEVTVIYDSLKRIENKICQYQRNS